MLRKEEALNASSGLYFFLPTGLKELTGGASHHTYKTTPLQVLHGADKKLLPFISFFFFPSCLLLPQPCEQSSESQRKAEEAKKLGAMSRAWGLTAGAEHHTDPVPELGFLQIWGEIRMSRIPPLPRMSCSGFLPLCRGPCAMMVIHPSLAAPDFTVCCWCSSIP